MSINPVQTGTGVFDRLYYRYTYDSLGNITSIEDVPVGASSGTTTAYQYDNQSQLTKASCGSSVWDYQYDTYGNLRAQSYANGNSVQRSITYNYGDSNWQDLLTGVSGTKNGTSFSGSYIYDGAGNPTSYYNVNDRRTWVMAWKNGRELASATRPGLQIDYDYDVSGLRTLKQAGSAQHIYTYASGQLLREKYTKDGTSYTLDFVYDQSNRPYLLYLTTTTGSTSTSVPYYYILNLQGDVIHVVNTAGEAVASYTYDAFGNILSASGSLANINPLRYRGYYYDAETGFYYVSSRYYDPEIGRWINADSVSMLGANGDFASLNLFAYCGNNPVSRRDASGHAWETIWDILSLGSSAVEVAVNPYDPWAWIGLAGDVADVLIPFIGGIGETTRALKAASQAAEVIDTASDAKKGWKIGEDITNLTKAGNKPSWSTLRSRYWKNKAHYFASEYSEENVSRMMRGLAPQFVEDGELYSMELHHILGRDDEKFYFFFEITPKGHAEVDPFRFLK